MTRVWIVRKTLLYDHDICYVGESEAAARAFCASWAPDRDGHHDWRITEAEVGAIVTEAASASGDAWHNAQILTRVGDLQRQLGHESITTTVNTYGHLQRDLVTTTETLTLADFLLARIAEDEAAVADWPHNGPWGLHESGRMWVDGAGRPIHAPRARVLAECEAKRRIVNRCARCIKDDAEMDYYSEGWSGLSVAEPTLRALALPYADHPDYRDEWRLRVAS